MCHGWHMSFLPHCMIMVVRDGIFIVERIHSSKDTDEALITSTKNYLFRKGYEEDETITIHDLRENKVNLKKGIKAYSGICFKNFRNIFFPWILLLQKIGNVLGRHILSIFAATAFCLLLSLSFYGYVVSQNKHKLRHVHMIQDEVSIKKNKQLINRYIESINLLIEAKAPSDLFERMTFDGKSVDYHLSKSYIPSKNKNEMEAFFKQYDLQVTIKEEKGRLILFR